MALRVAIGFVAVALIVVTANFITQQSAPTRARVRELLVQHEPLVRATESLAAAVSLYERVVVDQSESSVVSRQQVQLAARAHAARPPTRTREPPRISRSSTRRSRSSRRSSTLRDDGRRVLTRQRGARRPAARVLEALR